MDNKYNDETQEELMEVSEQASDELETDETDELDCDEAVSEYNDTAAQISDMEIALQESNDKYLRLFAEYDNYRKRTAKEKTEAYNNAASKCIESILPVIDSFERSLESDCTDENYKNGMKMIFNQLMDILTKMNVSEVESLGTEFNPNIHNAISQQDDTDYASGYVCQVYQKGYKLGDKLIRPAMVAVAN